MASSRCALLAVAALLACPAHAAAGAANPIRKVVSMLQSMQQKVTEEGVKEKEIYEKFMCYCKTSGSDLDASMSAASGKISALPSEIEALEEQKAQDEATLKKAQEDRSAAKSAMAEATAIREKEASAYAALKAEQTADMDAVAKAVAALEKGMAGAFVQTNAAQVLRRLATKEDLSLADEDRQAVLAFASGSSTDGYTPSSGQITGILKELGDDMSRTLATATSEEESAIATYEALMAAKTKEVNACTASIEAKTKSIGELGVDIVEKKNDLTETEAAYAEDKKFLADLKQNCATKEAEWQVVVKTRADELAALAETIKILNDDDALELFKKTLPSASSSLIQVGASSDGVHRRVTALLKQARHGDAHRVQFDLIALALTGKKVNFGKVVSMIDEMVAMLKEEQLDDDHKKEYCLKQFDFTDDKKKALERTLSLEEAGIDRAKEAIATLKDEIAALEAGIKALDKSVAEATELRKEQNVDFTELMASDTAANQLLSLAKNRLNQFYNPKLYKAPPKVELSAEGRIEASLSGTMPPTEAPGGIAGTGVTVLAEIAVHTRRAAPPPPPAAVGAYKTKGEETTGVIAMLDLLIKDLEKEMTEATTEEKESQAEYETMMKDSAMKRVQDSKSLAQKVEAKAAAEGDLMSHTEAQKAASKEHMATLGYEATLHAECDWLLKYFDVRKEARAGEVDSLVKAKAVLSGADYSLLQRSQSPQRRRLLTALVKVKEVLSGADYLSRA